MSSIEAHPKTLIRPDSPPGYNTPEAEMLLEQMRREPRNIRFEAPNPKIPEVNKHGLVIPPHKASYDIKNLTPWQEHCGVRETGHHIYWSRKAFESAGPLAKEFRDHSLNRVMLPNFQHKTYHRKHDPFIYRYPKFLIPSREVMITFLDEASNLELLGITVKRLDKMMDSIDDFNQEQEESFEESIEMTARLCGRVIQSEIVFPSHVQNVIYKAQRYIPELFEAA